MSFTVRFWTFSKRYNSTKIPALADATNFDCIIKDGSAIINPKIVLDLGATTDPSQYNYCRIPAFNRYYWVREWSFDRGLWTATLEVDVLASYKTEIGASNLYILRAAGAYNGNIVDNLYPCKTGANYDKTAITDPFEHAGAGSYVVGVVSPRGMYGSITYYILDRSGLATLCNYLINDAVSLANNFSWADATQALQNSIVEPLQYIKSVVWLPFPYTELPYSPQQPANLNIFSWAVPNTNAQLLFGATVVKNYSFTVKKHPDTNSRGNYVNASPYTLATLCFPPFGNIEIDTSVLCNAATLDAELRIDCINGKGVLTLSANGYILNRIEGQIGVPIQLAQVKSDYIGGISSIASGISSAISGALTGGPAGIAGAISGGIGGIGNAINSLAPRAQSIGSGGGFAHLRGDFELDFQFFRPVDDDLTQNGRPLCEKRVINTLSGYMLIQDGDVSIAGTRTEAEQIRAYLEGGFYYE